MNRVFWLKNKFGVSLKEAIALDKENLLSDKLIELIEEQSKIINKVYCVRKVILDDNITNDEKVETLKKILE